MRIIGGSVGGRLLRAPRGRATRPTADRVREAIFNILASRGDAPERVLDLYAGSGALGLEALSRGAREAIFVEQHAATARLIGDNARALGLDGARVLCTRTIDWLRRASINDAGAYGWIFLDPPYDATASGELDRALALVGEKRLLAPGGAIVAEHADRAAPKDAHEGLALSDRRRYGQTAVSFYTREGA